MSEANAQITATLGIGVQETSINADVSNGLVTGTTFAMPPNSTTLTWQPTYGTAPGAVTIVVQGSFDRSNYFTLDTSTNVNSEIRTINTAAPFVRCTQSSRTGGTTTTCKIIAKAGLATANVQSLLIGDGTAAVPAISTVSSPNTGGIYFSSGQNIAFSNTGIGQLAVFNGTIQLPASTALGFAVGVTNTATDTKIARIGAGVPGSNIVGAGTATGGFPVSLFTSTTAASNASTTETDLITYTLPASTLNTNLQKVRIKVFGSAAANTNNKTYKLYFGATVISTVNISSATATVWEFNGLVTRTGAATQLANAYINFGGSGYNGFTTTTPGETLSGTLIIKVTGQSAVGANDVTAQFMMVEWVP